MKTIKLIGFIGGGYSLLPKGHYMIGYMNGNGSVNWEYLNELLQQIANNGAWGVRFFPPWPTDHEEWENLKPFRRVPLSLKIEWNEKYFENLSKIFRLAWEQYNLVPIFDLFNGSEARVVGEYRTKHNSPWAIFDNYFYGDDANRTRHKWIRRIVGAAGDIPVWFQLCNEPGHKKSLMAENMLADTFERLVIECSHPMENIITGLDVWKSKQMGEEKEGKNRYYQMYKNWKERAIDTIIQYREINDTSKSKRDEINNDYIKATMWTPIHAMNTYSFSEFINHDLEPGKSPPRRGTRNMILSFDGSRIQGERPDKIQSLMFTLEVIDKWPGNIESGKVMIEFVVGKETDIKDPFRQATGILQAMKEKGLEMPENYWKYPRPFTLPDWLEVPSVGEIKKSIKIKNPTGSDWEWYTPGSDMYIQWSATGIGIVKIFVSKTGLKWRRLSTSAFKNEGYYTWTVEDVRVGKNYLKIQNIEGTVLEKKSFTVKELIQEKSTPWQFVKKHWRWLVGIGSVLTGSLLVVFAVPGWIWRLAGFLTPLSLAFFQVYKKKK